MARMGAKLAFDRLIGGFRSGIPFSRDSVELCSQSRRCSTWISGFFVVV
jgi:hypothetical protein